MDKSNGVDGLPEPLSLVRIQVIRSKTLRFNYDQTLSPTLLLHIGAGYIRYNNPDTVPPESADFDSKSHRHSECTGHGFSALRRPAPSAATFMAAWRSPWVPAAADC